LPVKIQNYNPFSVEVITYFVNVNKKYYLAKMDNKQGFLRKRFAL